MVFGFIKQMCIKDETNPYNYSLKNVNFSIKQRKE